MIKQKKKPCSICGKPSFTKKCTYCANAEKIAKLKEKAKKPIKKKPARSTKKPQSRGVKEFKIYPKISVLKKHADDIFSLSIRLRDSDKSGLGKCITCEKKCFFYKDCGQNGHFRSRARTNTRYHRKNNHLQCSGCNGRGGGMPFEYGRAIDKLYGEGTADEIHRLSLMSYNPKAIDYIEVIETSIKYADDYLKDKNLEASLKEIIQDKINFYKRFVDRINKANAS